MKIFVTGGTGFIGGHVVKELIYNGHRILVLSRSKKKQLFPTIVGDLDNISSWFSKVNQFNPDIVLHMAWDGLPDYSFKNSRHNEKICTDFYNKISTLKLKKIITLGTCWEYEGIIGKVHEEMPVNPKSYFPAAKNQIRKVGEVIFQESKIPFIWVRPFYVYGSGQRKTSLIPYVYGQMSKNSRIEIKELHGKNDYLFVEDLAKGISLLVSKANKSSIYNIGTGVLTDNETIIRIISRSLREKPLLTTHLKNEDSKPFWADIAKMKNEFGWEPKVTVREGINITLKYLEHV